jgi:hypothetical protein
MEKPKKLEYRNGEWESVEMSLEEAKQIVDRYAAYIDDGGTYAALDAAVQALINDCADYVQSY